MFLTFVFFFLLFGMMGKLISFAFKFSWGLIKIALFLVFLPAILVALVVGGLLYIAFPLLIVALIIGLIAKQAA